jgi:SAM-dependent methyltransferase
MLSFVGSIEADVGDTGARIGVPATDTNQPRDDDQRELAERVRRFYDDYHDRRGRGVDDWMRREYWSRLIGRVLEIGGGTRLPPLEGYVLIDVSPTAAARATERGVAACVADGAALPFSDRAFETTACHDVLEHAVDPDAVIAEMARVAGRRVVIAGPNYVGHHYHGGADRYVPLRIWTYLARGGRGWRRIDDPHLSFDERWAPDRDAIAAVNAGWAVERLRCHGFRAVHAGTWRGRWRVLDWLPVLRYIGPDMLIVADRSD